MKYSSNYFTQLKIYILTLLVDFQCNPIGGNYILAAYHYDANNTLTTLLKNRTGPCILNGIKMKI